jgi:hypothetical protein
MGTKTPTRQTLTRYALSAIAAPFAIVGLLAWASVYGLHGAGLLLLVVLAVFANYGAFGFVFVALLALAGFIAPHF